MHCGNSTKRRLGLAATAFVVFLAGILHAQESAKVSSPSGFQIGEKLTYNVSFNGYDNVAFAEIYVASRGKFGGKDAVELRSRLKTLDLVSAAFYPVDESRTTFVSVETGLPLYARREANMGILPKETSYNFLDSPAIGYDLLALIYKFRNSGGSGAFTLLENGNNYEVALKASGNEKVKTDAGEFDTVIFGSQSSFFTENGIENLRVNISLDDKKVPVMIRFRTSKGEFRATLSGIQVTEPEPDVQPTPIPLATPKPTSTPKPVATPTPYIENQPLLPELGFEVGETLEYKISSNGRVIANFVLQAKERKQFMGSDSLLLQGTITSAEQGNDIFSMGDFIRVQVNPDTLAPKQLEIKFAGSLSSFNQTVQFDQRAGTITFGGTSSVEAPIGTHSILSLLYALRSFNLKPSKDLSNPVNDTRVAVFWASKASIFTLRPSNAETIDLQGKKVSAQLIAVNTGIPELDRFVIKIWLGNDERRIPLRFIVRNFQADLISESIIQPK